MSTKFLGVLLSIVIIFGGATLYTLYFVNRHKHTYNAEWSNDETNHWLSPTCEHVDLIAGKEEHIWNNGVIVLEPTQTTTGTKVYTCQVCDAEKTEVVPIKQ